MEEPRQVLVDDSMQGAPPVRQAPAPAVPATPAAAPAVNTANTAVAQAAPSTPSAAQTQQIQGAFSMQEVQDAVRDAHDKRVQQVSNSGAEMDLSPLMRQAYQAGQAAGIEESRLKELMRKLWDTLAALMKRIGQLMGRLFSFPSGHQLTDAQLQGREPVIAKAQEGDAEVDASGQSDAAQQTPMTHAMQNMFHAGQGLTNAMCGKFTQPSGLGQSANADVFDPVLSYAPGAPTPVDGASDLAEGGQTSGAPSEGMMENSDGSQSQPLSAFTNQSDQVSEGHSRHSQFQPNIAWLTHDSERVREAYFQFTLDAQSDELRAATTQVHRRREQLEQIVTRIAAGTGMSAQVVAQQMRVDEASRSSLDPAGDYSRAEEGLLEAVGTASLVRQAMLSVMQLPQAHELRRSDPHTVLEKWDELLHSSLDSDLPPSPMMDPERVDEARQAIDAENGDSDARQHRERQLASQG